MHPPNGKIGRLPEKNRNELNQRLADGESAAPIFQWLNALPEVQAVLAGQFQAETGQSTQPPIKVNQAKSK